jgi:hypothetical protein
MVIIIQMKDSQYGNSLEAVILYYIMKWICELANAEVPSRYLPIKPEGIARRMAVVQPSLEPGTMRTRGFSTECCRIKNLILKELNNSALLHGFTNTSTSIGEAKLSCLALSAYCSPWYGAYYSYFTSAHLG